MSETIDSLTKEQQEMLAVYTERYTAMAVSTEQPDRKVSEDCVRKSYQYFYDNDPEGAKTVVPNPEFVWAESPMAGQVLAAQYAKGDTNVTVDEVRAQAGKANYGSFNAYWVSSYAFIGEQLPVKHDDLLQIAIDITKNCGVYWTFEDIVIMTPKPKAVHIKNDKLHNVDGLAIEYPNGDGLYAFNGERKESLMEVIIASRMEGASQDGDDKETETT